MSQLATWFSFLGRENTDSALVDIYPFPFLQGDFICIDVVTLYSKILTDTFERTEGLSDEQQNLLWDNCLKSESSDGLVTMLAKAMAEKKDLFLKFDPALKVVVEVKGSEVEQIRRDYAKSGTSALGVYVSFANYKRSDMLKLYSALEYYSVSSLYKNMALSKAIQIKIDQLRATVGATDAAVAKAQAVTIADGLKAGKDVYMDSKDVVETAKPDMAANNLAMEFIAQKQSYYSGLPASYITGIQSTGLQDTGRADSKSVERGLKNYFFSIVKPVAKALFDKDVTFKSDDFEMLDSALNTLKTFELSSEEFITADNKLRVINKLFGFPADTKGGPKDPVLPVDPNAPPPKPGEPSAKPIPPTTPRGA